ncbi:MAG: DUF975 family protein [Lachnospiraceae bacterium]|nr:DUF975 family protein [Lachnospiraceae bacterium]
MSLHEFSTRLKIASRTQIINRIGTVIGAFLMHMAIYLPLPFLLSYLNTSTPLTLAIYFAGAFLIRLYSGILMAGENFIYLKCATGAEPATLDLLYGFRNQTAQIIKLRLIPAIILQLVDIPVLLITEKLSLVMPDTTTMLEILRSGDYETIMRLSEELFPVTSLSCLIYLMQFLITLAVNVAFSQTIFYMLDYPDLTAGEILSRSISLIRDDWGKYIYVTFSFIPWYVLGIATFYFGFLWSIPYQWSVRANFYLELVRKRSGQKSERHVDVWV